MRSQAQFASLSTPYYALTVRQIVHLACGAPGGPPDSSREFMRRLSREVLEGLYDDDRA